MKASIEGNKDDFDKQHVHSICFQEEEMQERDADSVIEPVRASRVARKQTMDANRRGSLSPRLPKVKGVTEVGQQLTQQLQSRIYTASSKSDNPHFSLGEKRKSTGKLAPLSKSSVSILVEKPRISD